MDALTVFSPEGSGRASADGRAAAEPPAQDAADAAPVAFPDADAGPETGDNGADALIPLRTVLRGLPTLSAPPAMAVDQRKLLRVRCLCWTEGSAVLRLAPVWARDDHHKPAYFSTNAW